MSIDFTPGARYQHTDGEYYIVVNYDGHAMFAEEEAMTDPEPLHLSVTTLAPSELTPAPDADRSAAFLNRWNQERNEIAQAWEAKSGLEKLLASGGVTSWQFEVREAHADYTEADAELKAAQAAVETAARKRAETIRNMVFLAGNQSAAAVALEINQSNVSRTLSLLDRP